ncbi:MAG TPA: hypothetical protein H9801_00350 [Candidatus Collinsella stercoripullorum]|nr:hypothetical protein [Candidatus Collinsella stercoripullorum]
MQTGSPVLYRPEAGARPRIDRAEMLRYLGYAGQTIEPDLARRIELVAEQTERDIAPRGVWQVFDLDADGADDRGLPCIRLAGTAARLTGRDIFRHLRAARRCAVLACTLGMESERRLRTLSGQSPLESALFDAACSAYVEAAVDRMDAEVGRAAAEAGLARNRRFSCGYGDCPIEAQDGIVAALNAGRLLGLTVTPTHLLLPTKSVTALIGLFEGEPADAGERPGCGGCRLRGSCAFRARGTVCYG